LRRFSMSRIDVKRTLRATESDRREMLRPAPAALKRAEAPGA
jgi:hypothetical protein